MQFFDKNKLNTGLEGEFIDEDEEKGVNGTVVDAKLLNSLGNEIENIIKAGGMTPSENENDQLLRAIKNLGGSGVSSSAENVSYDNSISGLQQKNYDFPKIKAPINDLTYISLNSVLGKIEKEENNYFLKGSISAASEENILLIFITIDGKEDYEILSFLGQFFNIDNEAEDIENMNWIDALENEIIVNGINNGWQFLFVKGGLAVKRKDNGELPKNTYSVTLNIKNRILLKPDENIIVWQYGIPANYLLKIINESGTAKIKSITKIYPYLRDTEWIFFTNNILENYIDLDTEHTSGIISSSGKKVIWTLKKNYQDLPYSIIIKYEDESQIQKNDFFTINITPDKNADISFTKGDAVNVQNAIDSLAEEQKKLTLTAENVSFDNSIANLGNLSGYDFPKFKTEIASYNLVLTDGTNDFNASISKQKDGSYLLSSVLANFNITNSSIVDIKIKSVNGLSSSEALYALTSILSQFFELENIRNPNYIDSNSEINIQDYKNFQIAFAIDQGGGPGDTKYVLKIKSSSALSTGTSKITLNIKNRVLRPTNTNIFSISMDFNLVNNIRLTQANGSAVYKGTFNGYDANMNACVFYSDLDMGNYFNLAQDSNTFTNTAGITSSSGKAVKFAIQFIASNIYYLTLGYQDSSSIQQGDVFTFNLTPDKNAALNPIYQNVTNVQQMGEALNNKIINAVSYPNLNQEIQIGTDPEGYKLFRRVTLLDYEFIADGEYHTIDTFKIPNETGIIKRFYKVDIWAILKSTNNIEAKLPLYQGDSNIRIVLNGVHYTIFEKDKWWSDNYKGLYCVYEYTKEK